MKRIGIESVLELATSIPQDLADDIGDKVESMSILIVEARKALTNIGLLSKEFYTAADIMTRRNQIMRCTTGSKSLEDLAIVSEGLKPGEQPSPEKKTTSKEKLKVFAKYATKALPKTARHLIFIHTANSSF